MGVSAPVGGIILFFSAENSLIYTVQMACISGRNMLYQWEIRFKGRKMT